RMRRQPAFDEFDAAAVEHPPRAIDRDQDGGSPLLDDADGGRSRFTGVASSGTHRAHDRTAAPARAPPRATSHAPVEAISRSRGHAAPRGATGSRARAGRPSPSRRRRQRPAQRTAFFASAVTFASSPPDSPFRAKATGHNAPSSRFA